MYIIFSILKRTKRKRFKLQRDFLYTVSGKLAYSSVLLDHYQPKGHGSFSSLSSGTFNPPHSCPLPQGGKLKPELCRLCWDSHRESWSGRKNVPSCDFQIHTKRCRLSALTLSFPSHQTRSQGRCQFYWFYLFRQEARFPPPRTSRKCRQRLIQGHLDFLQSKRWRWIEPSPFAVSIITSKDK